VGAGRCIGATLTPALSRRERGRGCGVAPLAEIPDRQRRDGGPERVVQREHPVVAVTMPSRRRHEVGHTIEKLEGLEFDDAVLSRGGGFALPSRGRRDGQAAASGTQPTAAPSHRSISSRKIRVRAVTAAGRSARTPRNRFGTEITHCRTGTGGMTRSARCAADSAMRRPVQDGQTPRPLRLAIGRAGHPWPRPAGQPMGTPRVPRAAEPGSAGTRSESRGGSRCSALW
jgi:hypothetical protein